MTGTYNKPDETGTYNELDETGTYNEPVTYCDTHGEEGTYSEPTTYCMYSINACETPQELPPDDKVRTAVSQPRITLLHITR